jgi:hypothetical protein
MLVEMGYEEIGLEISGLRVSETGDERLMFMDLLEFALRAKTDFEMVQAFLNVFLNEFATKILQDAQLKERLAVLRDVQAEAIEFLETEVAHATDLVELISRIQ